MSDKKPSKLASLGTLIFVCICVVGTINFCKRPAGEIPAYQLTSTSIVQTRESKSQTQTALPTKTAEPTSTPRPTDFPALIPNIWQADVTLNLQDRFGMVCSDIEEGVEYYSHTCKKGTILFAVVYGRGIVDVDLIEASYTDLNPSTDVAIKYLSFVATIPFVGNEQLQVEARNWVEQNVPQIKGDNSMFTTDINGIHFNLYGLPTAITLEIGDLR